MRTLLQDVSGRPSPQQFLQKGLVGMAGQAHDAKCRPDLLQVAGRRQSAHAGHRQIHDDDVHVLEAAPLDRLGAVAGLRNHLEIRLTIDQEPQPLSDRLMIFHQENAQMPVHVPPPSAIRFDCPDVSICAAGSGGANLHAASPAPFTIRYV
jgi:hypothetical protein